MATLLSYLVDTDPTNANRDFDSANAAAVWLAANYPDLVTSDVYVEITAQASSGLADTTPVSFADIVTDATHTITFRAADGHRAGMAWNDAIYRLYTTATPYYFVQFMCDYMIIDGVQVGGSGNTLINIYGRHHLTLTNLFVVGVGTNRGVKGGLSSSTLINCIGDNLNNVFEIRGYDQVYYNCSALNSVNGFYHVSTAYNTVFKNCLAIGNTTGFVDVTNATGNNNVCSDDTAPGTSNISNATVSFVSGTYQPVANCDADGTGADLTSEGVTTDITGATRTAPHDVGAVLAAGGSTPPASGLQAYVGGSWVPGVLNVRQGGAWVPGVLKRWTGGEWI